MFGGCINGNVLMQNTYGELVLYTKYKNQFCMKSRLYSKYKIR